MAGKSIAAGAAIAVVFCTAAITFSQTEGKAHIMFTPSTVSWAAAPPSMPPGAQAAVLEGDPSKAGPFTMRIKAPDGYRIAPHYHPGDEHVTVLQGALMMGMGEKVDMTAAREMTTGSYGMMPAGVRHFASMKGETILQLHGIGPWGITYVNAADDPRNNKSQ